MLFDNHGFIKKKESVISFKEFLRKSIQFFVYFRSDLYWFHRILPFQLELSLPLLQKCVIVKMAAIVPIGMTHTPVSVPCYTLAECVKTVSNEKFFSACLYWTINNKELKNLFFFWIPSHFVTDKCYILSPFIKASDVCGKKWVNHGKKTLHDSLS